MIPKDLQKPIDEIKTPSNKILIICLILAIVFLGTFLVSGIRNSDKHCKSEKEALKVENARLNKFLLDRVEEDNKWLKKRQAYIDSITILTNYLNQKLQQ